MMKAFETQLTLLEQAEADSGSFPIIKLSVQGADGIEYKNISYTLFKHDVERSARYWKQKLGAKGIKGRCVIGLWLRGISYSDLIHIWGIMRAGFVPQHFSLKMTDPSAVYELVSKAGAVALIHDVDTSGMHRNAPLPTFPADEVQNAPSAQEVPLDPIFQTSNPEELIMIYHTSGSTGGMPKLVPLNARWVDCLVRKVKRLDEYYPSKHAHAVGCSVGSFSHIANATLFMDTVSHRGCYIFPSTMPYSGEELKVMIYKGGLTRLKIFPIFLANLIREARHDPEVLKAMQKLEHVFYGGLILDPAEGHWAQENGIPLINVFGTTEQGFILITPSLDQHPLLAPLTESKIEFVPIDPDTTDQGKNGNGATRANGAVDTTGRSELNGKPPSEQERLLELVVLPESDDCPPPSLRSKDGKHHLGDLFVEVKPGLYLSKGRNDDWIKMEWACRCDTGSIEEDAMSRCSDDLINTAVVVGAGRPSPAMVVELKDEKADAVKTKEEILRRIRPFHKTRYIHERIDDPRLIFVVGQGTLPRTNVKGNVRRFEVEKLFKDQLDKAYQSCAAVH